MLNTLYVKNLALIEEVEIEFKSGLNILTGETGAGKSILMGSVNLALGAKAGTDVIGKHGKYALVELTFQVQDENSIQKLNDLNIFLEEGRITISRKIMQGHSTMKINGETVSAAIVKKVTENFIDIHGQHDHQSLLYKSNHLDIVDKYAKSELAPLKDELKSEFKELKLALDFLKEFNIGEDEKNRNIDFLKFEIDEIEKAEIQDNEDEEIEQTYRKFNHSKQIISQMDLIETLLNDSNSNSVSLSIEKSYQAIHSVVEYDEALQSLQTQISDIDSLLQDFIHDVHGYIEDSQFDQERYIYIENRYNLINTIKSKYGGSISDIKNHLEESYNKLEFYKEYDIRHEEALSKVNIKKAKVEEICKKISEIRKKDSVILGGKIKKALEDLNFGQVDFQIQITSDKEPTINGCDEAEFMISLNPGEGLKPLAKIASGGELSRIMLGIKSVLAGKDEIDTLIFDEIDSGISGRTAQKVSEKMIVISDKHQVICITHLPQIAAMADHHFLIEKNLIDTFTTTNIRAIDDMESTQELSRLLGGTEITEIVIENAKQMKVLANQQKQKLKSQMN